MLPLIIISILGLFDREKNRRDMLKSDIACLRMAKLKLEIGHFRPAIVKLN